MKTIGLVGGVASGKSLVAKYFVELGAGLLDADRAGHDVLAEDPVVQAALVERWGPSILAADGSIDRSAIAKHVFGSGDDSASNQADSERQFLESLLHERIRRRLEAQRIQFANEGRPAVVLDAPLLLEAGWSPLCDVLVMVESPRDDRLARSQARGWSSPEFDSRESAQWAVDEKRRAAHVAIVNDGTLDELRAAVRSVWERYVAPPA
jgi:dephospho-CoA kinase